MAIVLSGEREPTVGGALSEQLIAEPLGHRDDSGLPALPMDVQAEPDEILGDVLLVDPCYLSGPQAQASCDVQDQARAPIRVKACVMKNVLGRRMGWGSGASDNRENHRRVVAARVLRVPVEEALEARIVAVSSLRHPLLAGTPGEESVVSDVARRGVPEAPSKLAYVAEAGVHGALAAT